MIKFESLDDIIKYAQIRQKQMPDSIDKKYHALHQAMHYAITGGKAWRRVLIILSYLACVEQRSPSHFKTLNMLGDVVEMLHGYSLIHDDLPAMDNSDLRRGKPSCHKQFGEDIAILAGDALLTDVWGIIADYNSDDGEPFSNSQKISVISCLARSAGSRGIVLGQARDLDDKDDDILAIHRLKTATIMGFCCDCGAVVAGQGSTWRHKLYDLGVLIGHIFQMVDDYQDVSTNEGIDKPNNQDLVNQNSYLLFGEEKFYRVINQYHGQVLAIIDTLPNANRDYINELVNKFYYVVNIDAKTIIQKT
jgi:geranylgeranyl diphosphate synthase type II